MKVATFNINGVNQRIEALIQWLSSSAPDIVCLQELKADNNRFPLEAVRKAGYEAIWQGQSSWNGVAILAKGVAPIETRRGLPGDASDSQSRYIEAAVNGILVGCLYLPNGNPQPGPKFAYKLRWFERFNRHAESLLKAKHPVVLCGDFNVVPTDLDIYDTKSWKKNALLQPESRAAYARLIEQGWTDALRSRYPNQRIYTFWDYFRNHWQTNSGLRIDHLLLSADLKKHLVDAGVDREVRDSPRASDHAPVWIELKTTYAPEASRGKRSPVRKAPPKAKGSSALSKLSHATKGLTTIMGVSLSHPHKVLWPASGRSVAVTKLDLAKYYEAVGAWMMPHLKGRPCSLVRAPDGMGGEQFFQRHAMAGISPLFELVKVKGDKAPYVQIDRIEALAAVAQIGGLEVHPWNCVPNDPEAAGRLVFDLDPAPDVLFEHVMVAAVEIRERLLKIGLYSFCKTTGGKGLHVVTPLTGGKTAVKWPAAKDFAHLICAQMAQDSPTKYLDNMSKAQRAGKIFLDYLRNDRTSTAVAVLSSRARAGAPVSMPIAWSQVRKGLDPRAYTVMNTPALLTKSRGWDGYAESARSLANAIRALTSGRK